MEKHFTINELTYSETARRNNIDNTPTEEIREHLNELTDLLEDFRTFVGCPIRITSGYRCPKLNKLVKGSPTSAHLIGYAADMQPVGITFEEFKKRALKWAKEKEKATLENGAKATFRTFDQLIIEKSKTSQWIHIGMYNQNHEQRGMTFKMEV